MFRSLSFVLPFAVALTGLVSSAAAETASVHDNHLEYNGQSFFRVGSDRVTLGAYGEKKSPVLKGNYLEVQSALPADKLAGKVKNVTTVAIDFSKSTKTEIEANLNGIKVVNVGTAVTYEGLKTAKLKLVHLWITPVDITDATNATSTALSRMKSYGNDGRLANDILVVMEAELADSFTTSSSFEVSVSATTGITVTGKHAATSTTDTKVTLSAGTTFAYLLAKPKWNAAKTKIEKCTDDSWGPT